MWLLVKFGQAKLQKKRLNSLSLWQIINGEYNEKADEFNDVGLRMSAQPTDAGTEEGGNS